MKNKIIPVIMMLVLLAGSVFPQNGYQNFNVAVYARSYEVREMENLDWLDSIWSIISSQVHVDKIYLETHRDLVIVDEDVLEKVKNYFEQKGIQTGGGITYTINERNRFQTFCYTNPENRAKVKEIVELTARHFDQVILDDFFFTNCKCERCIAAKGNRSWTEFRLELMDEAAKSLILEPAKRVNPDVQVVIKYPNWYAHFQGLGFNLETQPALFDGLYTGTETRDAVMSAQHLQPYLGYAIFRYFANLKPGFNLGGWVDTGGTRYLDRYAEQLWVTLWADAPEVTLFDFRQLQRPLSQFETAPWQNSGTSFDVAELEKKSGNRDNMPNSGTIAAAAGLAFETIDPYLSYLGKPRGIKCYRPFHSTGEDFLPTFLGMIGLPVDIVQSFPEDEEMVLLTRSAGYDQGLVEKIRRNIQNGKKVAITSGLLELLQDRGIEDIAEIRYTTNKAFVDEYLAGRERVLGEKKIIIPQIKYLTNDSWEIVSAIDGPNGWPILHEAEYAQGSLYVLTVPDNYADLYQLPEQVLNRIRAVMGGHLDVQLEAPAKISLFLYDNNTLVVESFSDEPEKLKITADKKYSNLTDLSDNHNLNGVIRGSSGGWSESITPEKVVFDVDLLPHSFRVFRLIE